MTKRIENEELVAKRRAIIEEHEIAYDRWLHHEGPKPSEEQLDDDLDALDAEYEDAHS